MAVLRVTYMSQALRRPVPLEVILPADRLGPNGYLDPAGKKYKTLYLLHGLLGNEEGWLHNTRVALSAAQKGLAVVMPAGENSFYIDADEPLLHRDFGSFIGEELPLITRRMFPLSEKREDTYIGGLSMGGYGALRNGLKYADTYSRIIVMSPAIHFFEQEDFRSVMGEEAVFGDLQKAKGTDRDPRWLVKQLKERKPEIFLCCGLQDGLLPASHSFRDFLEEEKYPFVYREEEGIHDWFFWDKMLPKALDWLPLEEKKEGLHAGNVQ
ncbi:MAG: acetylesterase [Erysipelotrichaceae bacterium]|nr:acetylesterase [Erysipelotrichaceae bacterium]